MTMKLHANLRCLSSVIPLVALLGAEQGAVAAGTITADATCRLPDLRAASTLVSSQTIQIHFKQMASDRTALLKTNRPKPMTFYWVLKQPLEGCSDSTSTTWNCPGRFTMLMQLSIMEGSTRLRDVTYPVAVTQLSLNAIKEGVGAAMALAISGAKLGGLVQK